MLKALRHHPLMIGTAEVMVDAARYVANFEDFAKAVTARDVTPGAQPAPVAAKHTPKTEDPEGNRRDTGDELGAAPVRRPRVGRAARGSSAR